MSPFRPGNCPTHTFGGAAVFPSVARNGVRSRLNREPPKRPPVALGLERYYQYEGEEAGAGLGQLVNLASGNSLLRWSPFLSPGRGLSTVADLTYNSLEGTSESPAGNGWSLALSTLTRLGTPLRLAPDGLAMELVDGTGRSTASRRASSRASRTGRSPRASTSTCA